MEKENIILGRNPVFEYITELQNSSGCTLYIAENSHGKIVDKIIFEAKKRSIPIRKENKSFFTSLESSSVHQGIALRLSSKSSTINDYDAIEITAEQKGIIVILDHLTDPHNVGSIIRTAEALGCGAVVIPKNHSVGITPTVVKSSAGATAHIPIISITNIASFIDDLKKKGYWIIGSSDHATTSIAEVSDLKPIALVIGNEGEGMKKLTQEKCDHILKIPLKGKVSSLNASVAAGILLYELSN
jgi:23S rRNA (guanosine2251-2'-O)-methyltransferase